MEEALKFVELVGGLTKVGFGVLLALVLYGNSRDVWRWGKTCRDRDAQYEKRITDLEAKHDAELQALIDQHDRELAALEAKWVQRLQEERADKNEWKTMVFKAHGLAELGLNVVKQKQEGQP